MAESIVRVRFIGDSLSAQNAVGGLEKSMSGLGRTAKLAGTLIAGGLVGGLIAATKQAIDFDKAMRNVNSIAHLSEGQFKKLSSQTRALAKETGQGPKTLAEGMYDIVSSGFKANEAITILRASAKAATAGMTDTATATKGVVAILNAYHLSADQATAVSNTLFQEVNLGVNTFEELAANIGDTAPAAAALGIPFEQVAAGLATITLHGTNMAEASTQMGRVLSALVKPTTDLRKELNVLGFENGQAAIKSLGFVGVIRKLSDAADGNQEKLASWLGDIRGIRGVLNLSGKNLDQFLQKVKEMGAAQDGVGATQKAFAEQAKSISFQWKLAKASLAAAAIPIGNLLFPALTNAASALGRFAGFLDAVNNAPDLSGKARVIGDGFKAMASDVEDAFKRILFGYETVRSSLRDSGTEMHVPGIGEQIAKSVRDTDWRAVGAAIVDGISAALTTAGDLAANLGNVITQAVTEIDWNTVGKAAGPGLAAAMLSAVATLLDPAFWVKNWSTVVALALNALAFVFPEVFGPAKIGALLARPFTRLAARIGPLLGAELASAARLAVAYMGREFELLGPRAGRVFVVIVDLAERALKALPGIASRLMSELFKKFSDTAAKIPGLLLFPLKIIGIATALEAIAGLGRQAVQWIGGQAATAVRQFGTVVNKIQGWLSSAFNAGIISPVISAVGKVVDLVKWLLKQAGRVVNIGVHVSWPSPPSWFGKVAGRVAGVVRATGGFIPMAHGAVAGKDSVPAMLMPGEVVLNRAQQDKLGGPKAVAQMFGFSGANGPAGMARGGFVEPLHFARGGIIPGDRGGPGAPRRGGKPYPNNAGGKDHRDRYQKLTGAARKVFSSAEAVAIQIQDAQRTYDQLSRHYGISQEEAFTYDADGNEVFDPEAVGKHMAEIADLIKSRQRSLRMYDEEAAKLKAALRALQKAIDELKRLMEQEREKAAAEERKVRAFTQQLNQAKKHERELRDELAKARDLPHKTKSQRAVRDARIKAISADIRKNDDIQNSLNTRIKQADKEGKAHLARRSKLGDTLKSLQGSVGDAKTMVHDNPFDRRDVELDIEELRAEASEWAKYGPGTSSADTGGGDGGGSGDEGGISGGGDGDVSEALKQLGIGRLAAAIEGAQLTIIGAFAKGTIHVPETGLALVHAGESITPAGHPRSGGMGGEQPVVVQINSNDEVLTELLSNVIDVRVLRNAGALNARLGSDADRRRREGRYA